MAKRYRIVGDWGTSSLRLFLLDSNGDVVDIIKGLGISRLDQAVDLAFFDYIDKWQKTFDIEFSVLSGMVGSNIGWQTLPYLACPVSAESLIENLQLIHSHAMDVYLVPGVSCNNIFGNPDVMRGEEVQILGLFIQHPELAVGRQIFCLPGTHSKWVLCNNSLIEHFFTAATGELYELLGKHSTLFNHPDNGSNINCSTDSKYFLEGVKQSINSHLVLQLFQVRSKKLVLGINEADQAELMSGLLIAAEINAALDVLSQQLENHYAELIIVGDQSLAKRYQLALSHCQQHSQILNGDDISLSGLKTIADKIQNIRVHNAK